MPYQPQEPTSPDPYFEELGEAATATTTTPAQFGGIQYRRYELGNLLISSEDQRPIDVPWKDKIKAAWDWDKFNAPTVHPIYKNGVDTGRAWIIGGQHGVTAATELFGPEFAIDCKIASTKTATDRAGLGGGLNHNGKRPNQLAEWTTALAKGEEREVAVKQFLDGRGIEVAMKYRHNTIGCPAALMKWINKGNGVANFSEAVLTLESAYPYATEKRFQKELIDGLIQVLQRNGSYDRAHMAKRIAEETPEHWVGFAKASDKHTGRLLMDAYNLHARSYANGGVRAILAW